MRYKIEAYKPEHRRLLIELAKENSSFCVPAPEYLLDIALWVKDLKTGKMVGFVCGVSGIGETVYASHLFVKKKLRNKKPGYHVLRLLADNFEMFLTLLNKKAYEFFVAEDNIPAKNFFNKLGAKIIDKGYHYRKEL